MSAERERPAAEAEAVAGGVDAEAEGPNREFDLVDWLVARRHAADAPPSTSLMAAAMGDPEAVEEWGTEPGDNHREATTRSGPKRPTSDPSQFVTYLPGCEGCRRARWGSLTAEPVGDDITLSDVRERTVEEIEDAFHRHVLAVIDAPMNAGKTYGALLAADRRDEPVTYLAPRRDLYDDARDVCEELGLSAFVLPSAPRDCPTFRDALDGEDGAEIERRLRSLYARGYSPTAIHEAIDLPCESGEQACPYRARWEGFDPDEWDILIGNHLHGHLPNATRGRHVVIDEFPSAFIETLEGDRLRRAVDAYCERHAGDGFPFRNYADILARRDDPEAREATRAWFAEHPPEADDRAVVEQAGYHAHGPAAVFTLIFGDLGDEAYPFDRAVIPGEDGPRVGVWQEGNSREPEAFTLQRPPSFDYANTVVGLDGTPCLDAWRLALGERLGHRQVLGDVERREFVRDVLGVVGVAVNDHIKPYSSGNFVTVEQDGTLFEAVAEEYGEPVVFTTKVAREQYEQAGLGPGGGGPAETMEHFGNLRGTNRYAERRSAVVSGSPHFGDTWIRTLAAMNGDVVHPEGRGTDREYGDASRFVGLMRESQVGQAAMRVGRDGEGATVVFNTSAVPEWFPVVGRGYVERVWSDDQRDVHRAVQDLVESERDAGEFTTADVAEHPAVTCSRRTVRRTLNDLAERDVLGRRVDGRGYVYWPDGLHRVNDRGEVELPPLDHGDHDTAVHADDVVIYYMRGVRVPGRGDRVRSVGNASRADAAEHATSSASSGRHDHDRPPPTHIMTAEGPADD